MPRQRQPDNPNDNRFVRIARDHPDRGYSALAAATIAAAIEDERRGDESARRWLDATGARWIALLRPDED